MDLIDYLIVIGTFGLIIFGSIIINEISDNSNTKYTITAPDIAMHYTDNYTEFDGCIEFFEINKKRKFCGVYQIFEQNKEEK